MFAFLGFLVFLVLVVVLGLVANSYVQRLTHEASFARGRVPASAPDGLLRGKLYMVYGVQVGWQGKLFSASQSSGVNVFNPLGQRLVSVFTPGYKGFAPQVDGTVTGYEFRSSVATGIKNKQQEVFKLDYNLARNPGLVRIVVDEVVEIDPGRLLGKTHLQLLPGKFWTVGYFSLEKTASIMLPAQQGAPERL